MAVQRSALLLGILLAPNLLIFLYGYIKRLIHKLKCVLKYGLTYQSDIHDLTLFACDIEFQEES